MLWTSAEWVAALLTPRPLPQVTSFHYQGHLINALDTPGHADFGGERHGPAAWARAAAKFAREAAVDGVLLRCRAATWPAWDSRMRRLQCAYQCIRHH
jgi:hypothetical protein